MKKIIPVLIGAAVAAVLLLLWKHESDARRDGKIDMLTARIHTDSIRVDSLVRVSQKAETATVASIDTFTRLDTVWSRHRDTVTKTVDHIVHDTTADSTKIRQLAALVEETKVKADSTVHAAEQTARIVRVQLLVSFTAEREAWRSERKDLNEKIRLLEKQSRHWGVVLSGGYGPQRERDGAIRLGANAHIGIGYRY